MTTEQAAPKPTAKTMAFKIMFAAWAGNALIIYLSTRGVFIPDELKPGLSQIVGEALNTFLPLITTALASWITKIVAQISADKNVEKAKAQVAVQVERALGEGK